MQRIVEIVCRRAQEQGFVSPQDVRAVLANAGLPEEQWREVLSLAGDMLSNRDGRIYYCDPAASGHRHRHRLNRAVQQLIRGYQATGQDERRRQGRFDFVRPVQVELEDGRSFTLLSCDVSPNGIRVVAPFSLLGKKIRVTLPDTEGAVDRCFYARVVWSSLVGEGLYENGAAFLSVAGHGEPVLPASHPSVDFGVPMSLALPHGELPHSVRGTGHPRPR